ncbi:hypothetical protein D3C80_2117740 [compost metagenome]
MGCLDALVIGRENAFMQRAFARAASLQNRSAFALCIDEMLVQNIGVRHFEIVAGIFLLSL